MGIFRIQAYFFALIIALFFVACDSGENFKALMVIKLIILPTMVLKKA